MSEIPENDNTKSFTPLTIDTMVGHYRIVEKIGAGGMGEVYLAEDTRLDRQVALKFLPAHLSQDEAARARFTREAKSAAKLDHPNIVPVYEVGEFQGRPFFAMAHIEGKSLKEVIKESKLSINDAIEYTRQICEGLHKAHESGIVHRDIKPGNIIIDKDNKARILDFGLATVTGDKKLTKTGSTLGTLGYMSPEQIKGEKSDLRSDLFSVGVILYEMITGRLPFDGEYEAAIHYNIIHEEPEPVARYKSGTTGELQSIIDKALAKDISMRYQHADGMLADLKRLDTGRALTKRRKYILWLPAVLLLVLLAYVGKQFMIKESHRDTKSYKSWDKITFDGRVLDCDLSPDGRFLAYTVEKQGSANRPSEDLLFIRDLESDQPRLIYRSWTIVGIGWSPNGDRLLVSAQEGREWSMLLIPPFGGKPRVFTQPVKNKPYTYYSSRFCWDPGGNKIALIELSHAVKEITILDRSSGVPNFIPLNGEYSFIMDIDWSPDGNHFILLTKRKAGNSIDIVNSDGSNHKSLMAGKYYYPKWNADGSGIYYLKGIGETTVLYEQAINPAEGTLTGEPIEIVSGLQSQGPFSISEKRERIIVLHNQELSNIYQISKAGSSDDSVTINALTTGTSLIEFPSISPEGDRIVFNMQTGQGVQVYTQDLKTGSRSRLTYQGILNWQPKWSSDGQEIAFVSTTDSISRIGVINSRGGTQHVIEGTSINLIEEFCSLWWTPDNELLQKNEDGHGFIEINRNTGERKPIGPNFQDAFVFVPLYCNKGDKIAFDWIFFVDSIKIDGITATSGIWTMNTDGSDLKQVWSRGIPLGWSEDDRYLYFWTRERQPIMRLCMETKTVDTVLVLPEKKIKQVAKFPRQEKFIYVRRESKKDVMLISD